MAHHKDLQWVICPVCGKKFPTKWNEIYCSTQCKERANEYET